METCPICKSKSSKFEFVRHEQVVVSISWDGEETRKIGKVLYQSKKGKCTKCGAQIPIDLAPKKKGERHAASSKEERHETDEK